MKPNTIWYMFY